MYAIISAGSVNSVPEFFNFVDRLIINFGVLNARAKNT